MAPEILLSKIIYFFFKWIFIWKDFKMESTKFNDCFSSFA